MKFFYLFILLPFFSFSQNTKDLVVYLDSLEQLANEDNYQILRVMKDYYTDSPGCTVYDYYKSGKKKRIGNLIDKYNLLKSGEFIAYFENGNKASYFRFENNLPIGKFYTWYEKGNLKSEGEFLKSKFQKKNKPILKINQYWSRIGIHRIINGNGHYEDLEETIYSEGELQNGIKEGEWLGRNILDNSTFAEKYKAGVLISGVSTDSLKQTYPYEDVEEMTSPKITRNQFYRYLNHNLKIPASIQKVKISGKIVIEVTINKDGRISNSQIISGIGFGIDEEVTRVIQNFDQWKPAKKRGIPFESTITIPIYLTYGNMN